MLNITSTMGTKQSMFIANDLKQRLLREKTPEFLNAVGERGVEVARQFCGKYTPFIDVRHEIEGNSVKVIASDDGLLKEWDGGHSEEISPLLLAEFGSGFYVENHTGDPRGVQGALNKYGHAFNEKGWTWTENGQPFHSLGERPTMPMYRSYSTVVKEIGKIAQSVFGG